MLRVVLFLVCLCVSCNGSFMHRFDNTLPTECHVMDTPLMEAFNKEAEAFCAWSLEWGLLPVTNQIRLAVVPQEELDALDAQHYFGAPCGAGCRKGFYRLVQNKHHLVASGDSNVRAVWQHELCHAFGLTHVSGKPFGNPERCGD